jgi:hypothetical protein
MDGGKPAFLCLSTINFAQEGSMLRSLEVEIDRGTWPAGGAPGFPSSFTAGVSSYDVAILPTLLLIGQLTTPPLARGVSLSEFWAWVRYLHAFSGEADLRISSDFASLDSHQKTILSDDFGVGIPIEYLINKLNLVAWSDGRYFMDRMSALVSGPLPVPHTRGPRKAPDFVFSDRAGLLHVVECKGGQSGSGARDRQLSYVTSKGEPSGGVVQKRMVLLPGNLQGQRLACGLTLAQSGKSGTSSLKIVDPEYVSEFDLSTMDKTMIYDPIERAGFARLLRGAGFSAAAAAVAAPSGTSARANSSERLPTPTLRRSSRRLINRRNAAARAELMARGVPTFSIADTTLAGREIALVLPLPLTIDGAIYRRVIIRQGVTFDLIGDVRERGLTEEVLPSLGRAKADTDRISLINEGARAELRIRGAFASEIILERQTEAPTVVEIVRA